MPILRRQNHDQQEVDTEGSWAISYGDMITLLLSFFILFFSTDRDRDRMKAMESSLIAILNSNIQAPPRPTDHLGEDPTMEKTVQDRLNAKVFKVGQKLIIEFPTISFYNLGSVKLTQAGQSELKKFVSLYMPYSGNYILGVRAYTDNKKVRPNAQTSYSDNLELSALRSVAAMRILQVNGIPLNRMRLGGYGELKLTAEELNRAVASTPQYQTQGLALARKVVLVVEPEPKEQL